MDIYVARPEIDRGEEVLTTDALDFVAALPREFGARRDELFAARTARRAAVAGTGARKMTSNALSSGAQAWLADLEGASIPHRRNVARAIGGKAAFIPSRKNEAVNANAFAMVVEDKQREAADGSSVGHPDLVPETFDPVLDDQPHQVGRLRDDVTVLARIVAGSGDADGWFAEAREIFERVAPADEFVDFLTLPAYAAVVAVENPRG